MKGVLMLTPHDTSTTAGKSKERFRRIFITGGMAAVVKICSVSINLITVPLTVNYLGPERYGLWMTISSVLSLMSFADLGLGNGLLNAISKSNGRNSVQEAKYAVSSTFFILLCLSIFLLILFASVYPFIEWYSVFNVKSSLAIRESGPTIFVLVVMLLINMPLGVIQRIQEGYQEGYLYQSWLLLGTFVSFAMLILCVHFKCGLVWLVFSFSCGQLFSTVLNGIFVFSGPKRKLFPTFKFFDFKLGKSLIRSGFIFFLLGLFTLLGNTSDDIIIAHTIGTQFVAGYEIVKKVFLFSMLTQFIIQPLWPAFAEAIESGDIDWAQRTLKRSLVVCLLVSGFISLPLLLFGKQIIQFWVGDKYLPSWSLLLGFYCFVLIANYGGVMSTFLNSGVLLSKQLLIVGLSSISSLVLKVFLISKFDVSGVIWATVLSYTLFYLWPSYQMVTKYFKSGH